MRVTLLAVWIGCCGPAVPQDDPSLPAGLEIKGDRIAPYAWPALTPTHTVASLAELQEALAKAKAGDVVEIADGTYDAFRVTLPEMLQGTADRKIVLRARSPQGVVFTGATRFKVEGRHLQLQGFQFKGCREATVILGGRFNRLTRCQFLDCGHPQKTQSEVVILPPGAQNNELDYTEFAGSLSMSVKVRADAADSPDGTKDNYLHHNTFRDIRRLSSNGQEAIQLAGPGGGGTRQVMNTRVEHNLFLRAGGDREAISVKAPWSTLRWNVFKDMDAALNLRGASDCVVEGNVHINTRPMRVCGERHRIVNNYFLGSGIFLSHGSPGYGAARDNLIAHNTVLADKSALQVGAQTQPVSVPAEKNRILNNILLSRKKVAPVTADAAARAANAFESNLLWAGGAEFEVPAESKDLRGDPLIPADPNEYVPVPGEGSPALQRGVADLVPRNIRGDRRTSPNIGAY